MPPEVVSGALDFYKQLKSSPTARNQFVISFYGGEPSLEPDLIYQAVKETKEKMNDCHVGYYLTSNGTFYRHQQLIDFLIRNNFTIQFSIDGVEEEHDKFRVYRNGGGSYADVMKLLGKLKHYPNVKVLVTMHPDHDWQRLGGLFRTLRQLNPAWRVTLSSVEVHAITVEEMKSEFRGRVRRKLKEFKETMIEKMERGIALSPLEDNYLSSLFSDYSFNFTNHWTKTRFVKTCFPGSEVLFVDVDGKLHMCEKIPTTMEIGDIYNGLNPEAMFSLWTKINRNGEELECHDCPYQNFCNFCFVKFQGTCDDTCGFVCDDQRKEDMRDLMEFICRAKMLGGVTDADNGLLHIRGE
jgi:uncharacterized protein